MGLDLAGAGVYLRAHFPRVGKVCSLAPAWWIYLAKLLGMPRMFSKLLLDAKVQNGSAL